MEIRTTIVLTVLMYLWNSFLGSNDVTYVTLFFVTYMTTYFDGNCLVLDMFLLFITKLLSLKPFSCLKLTLKDYKPKDEILVS